MPSLHTYPSSPHLPFSVPSALLYPTFISSCRWVSTSGQAVLRQSRIHCTTAPPSRNSYSRTSTWTISNRRGPASPRMAPSFTLLRPHNALARRDLPCASNYRAYVSFWGNLGKSSSLPPLLWPALPCPTLMYPCLPCLALYSSVLSCFALPCPTLSCPNSPQIISLPLLSLHISRYCHSTHADWYMENQTYVMKS